MAEQDESSQNKGGSEASKVVSDFVKTLTDEQRMLVVLKRQLYDGNWDTMLDDLRNRWRVNLIFSSSPTGYRTISSGLRDSEIRTGT